MKRLMPLLVLGLIVVAADALAGGDAVAGRKVAIDNCSRCHVVGDYNPMGGIDSTPWLPAQAPKFSSWMGAIFGRAFTVLASRTILGQLASNQVLFPGHWESIHT